MIERRSSPEACSSSIRSLLRGIAVSHLGQKIFFIALLRCRGSGGLSLGAAQDLRVACGVCEEILCGTHHLVLGDAALQSPSIVIVAGEDSTRQVLLDEGTMLLEIVLEVGDEELLQRLEASRLLL